MPFYGPGHFESRRRVGFSLLGIVLTVGSLLIGLFADLSPRPAPGEPVTATVYAVVPDSLGKPDYVGVRAFSSHGAVSCSMGKDAFPDGVLPELNARIPVGWTPEYCFWGEPVEQLPRWNFFLAAGVAGVLTGLWLYGTAKP